MALLKTHPNFKSAVPEITDVNEIEFYVVDALTHQNKFMRIMIPPAIPDLKSFKIDLEKVDRLYHLRWERGSKYGSKIINSMIIRLVDHKDNNLPPLYVELWTTYLPEGYYLWDGILFISADVDSFMKVILEKYPEKDSIYDFLEKEDGIQIEKEFDKNNDVKFQEAKKLYPLK